jgi:hypothetical protein
MPLNQWVRGSSPWRRTKAQVRALAWAFAYLVPMVYPMVLLLQLVETRPLTAAAAAGFPAWSNCPLGCLRLCQSEIGGIWLVDRWTPGRSTGCLWSVAMSGSEFALPGDRPRAGLDAACGGILRFTDTDCPYVEEGPGYTAALNFAQGMAVGRRDPDGARSIVGADGQVWGREGEKVVLGGGPPLDHFVDCGAPQGSELHVRFVAEGFLPPGVGDAGRDPAQQLAPPEDHHPSQDTQL